MSSEVVDVFGFGENSVDRVRLVPHLPGASGGSGRSGGSGWSGASGGATKIKGQSSMRLCGGQVATTMVACARLGLRAAYAGAVGNDEDGRLVRETLTAAGVRTDGIVTRPAATRSAVISVEATSGERVVLAVRSPELDVPAEALDRTMIGSARVVHVDDTDIRASLRIATFARDAGRMVTTDIDRGGPDMSEVKDLIALATHPILSERALELLTGHEDAEQGLRALRRKHDGLLCVTLGPRGSMALDEDRITHVPAFKVDAVDTTGAGDVFRAGFIYGLLRGGETMAEILRFANAAAAVSCTKMGAIDGAPNLADVQEITK